MRRRSIQTVLYDSLQSLTKLLAPIMPHTMEEVWSYIDGVDEESVQLTDMPEVTQIPNAQEIKEKWEEIVAIRDEILKALEEARNEKIIGKSLEAKVTLYPSKVAQELLSEAGSLEQLLIVSKVEVAGQKENAPDEAKAFEHVHVIVQKAEGETCERCWNVSTEVGKHKEHPTLCSRCFTVITTE